MLSKQGNTMLTIMRTLGWVAILLSVIILLASAAIRLADMTHEPTDAFGVRYVQHPGVALLHIVPGLLFLT